MYSYQMVKKRGVKNTKKHKQLKKIVSQMFYELKKTGRKKENGAAGVEMDVDAFIS